MLRRSDMAQINSFRELVVWQKAMDLAETCYVLTRRFSRQDEALGNEIRKSCVGTVTENQAAKIVRDAEEVGRMLRGLAGSLSRRFN